MNIRELPNWLKGFNRNWLFHGSGQVLLIGLASRLLVFVSAIIGYAVLGPRGPMPDENLWNISVPFVNLFCRWDTDWYARIAVSWYPPGGDPVAQIWNWFPLYPIVMRGVGSLFIGFLSLREAVMVAGFIVSNVLFFVSLLLFYKLSNRILGNSRLAVLSTIFFSFWPAALFFSAAYSESLFMALALGAFYFLEKGEGKKATLLGFLAGFTRGNAFLICIPFFILGLQKRRWQSIAQSIIVASPYLWFSLYGYLSTGLFPVREVVYRTYWGIQRPLFLQIMGTINLGYAVLCSIEFFLIFLPFCILLFRAFQVKSLSQTLKAEGNALKYWALALVVFITILFYSEMFGVHRYAMIMLPLYWVYAQTWSKNQKIGVILLLTMATIMALGSILFVTWHYYI